MNQPFKIDEQCDFKPQAALALQACKGTPAPVLGTLQRLLARTLQDPDTLRALAVTGFTAAPDTAAALAAEMRRDCERWGSVIKMHAIRLDK